ncbi:MAG: hypothetical protein KDM63_03455, partial [Verrucomicrobiae bacterium]|nr:hypothetical protein [Verrucomicrobiae bacterium]
MKFVSIALRLSLAMPVIFSVSHVNSADDASHHSRKPIPGPEELAKLPPDGGNEYNRLVFEKSPYLL